MIGKLYLVPTPIGNLEDMTYRAVRILDEVELVLVEDTRVSARLLKHYAIETPTRSFHQHNEHKAVENIIEQLLAGINIAQISDAGTPGISDPGYLLVKSCLEKGIPMECLPGATAFVPALVMSGLPNHHFKFVGFLPTKKGRKAAIEKLEKSEETVVLYESPHKILTTLKDLSKVLGSHRKASLSREISKKFEEHRHGTLQDLVNWVEQYKPKGEMALVVEGKN